MIDYKEIAKYWKIIAKEYYADEFSLSAKELKNYPSIKECLELCDQLNISVGKTETIVLPGILIYETQ